MGTLLALYFQLWLLWAKEVVIQGEQVTDIEYHRYVEEKPQRQSYIDYWHSQEGAPRAKLLRALKQAQFHFLKGSLEKAKSFFREMADQRFKQHWDLESRKSIHYALLRLAQLELQPAQRRGHLKEALFFDSHIQVNPSLFPPPIVREYQALKENIPLQIYPLPQTSDLFSEIIINGKKKGDSSLFFRTHGGRLRISFLSNKYKAIHKVTTAGELEKLHLPASPMATGSCEKPQFNIKTTGQKFLFYNGQCQSLPLGEAHNLFQNEQALMDRETSKNPTQWRSSHWVWAGVSILAAGLLWNHLNTRNSGGQESQRPPTPREISNR